MRVRQKSSMPHVSSQWQEGGHHGSDDAKLSAERTPRPTGYLRPLAIPPCRHRPIDEMRQSPGMNALAPENDRWGVGSIQHIKQLSENKTPISAVESVFDLYTTSFYFSPTSSNGTSFIAELEDTSPIAVQSRESSVLSSPFKSPALSYSSMEFKSTQTTSRAMIKVVDETIAAIEDTNRKLLARATAAEETAKLLQEQNSELEQQIKHCNRTRPKTAPAQPRPSEKVRSHHRPSYSIPPKRRPEMQEYRDPTPLSTFNAKMDKYLLPPPPVRESRPGDDLPLYPPLNLKPKKSNAIETTPTPTTTTYISHRPTSLDPPTRLSAPPRHHQRPPPIFHTRITSLPNNPNARNQQISAPLQSHDIGHHEVATVEACHSSTQNAKIISLEEARRRAKPLPPLGPMSPSILRGVVEIGTPILEGENDADGGEGETCRRRGLSGWFRWKRKEGGMV